jgi:hypothetical protein
MARRKDVATPEAFIEALGEPRRSEIEALHELIRKTRPHSTRTSDPDARVRHLSISIRLRPRGRVVPDRPREQKASISLHVLAATESGYLAEAYKDRLPRADIGKSCVRFKYVEDVDLDVLEELIRKGSTTSPPGAIEG